MATTFGAPQGGTTSLPQYLQQRQQTGAPTTQPTVSAPTAKPTFGQQPQQQQQPQQPAQPPAPPMGGVTIPPAPPPPSVNVAPAPPGSTITSQAPAAPKPAGFTGQEAPGAPIGMGNLKGVLEQMLGQPGRYDNALIEQMRTAGTNRLDDARRLEEDRLRADAAGRGVYRSTGLTNSLGDVSERYVRGLAENETGLMEKVANARQQDLLSAIQATMGYGQGEMQNQQLNQNFMLALAQLGMLGGPTIPGAVGDFGTLPAPQVSDNSWIYQLLGQTMQQPKGA